MIKLSAKERLILEVLNKGGTWEARNLPAHSRQEMQWLFERGLVEHKGHNGICEYWAITEEGKDELAISFVQPKSRAEFAAECLYNALKPFADYHKAFVRDDVPEGKLTQAHVNAALEALRFYENNL